MAENVLIKNNVFRDADYGVFIPGANDADNCDVVNNSFSDINTRAINHDGAGTWSNSVIANNAIDGKANTFYGIYITNLSSTTIAYNDIYDWVTAAYGGSASAGTGSLTSDPLFVSATDLKLQPGSPCLDAGAGNGTYSEVPTDDYRDQARPVDLVGYANAVDGTDIGAFEMLASELGVTCWSFTAKYKHSNRLFTANGPDAFPKNLRIPKNVDILTGKMIDEGKLIDPSDYNVIQ